MKQQYGFTLLEMLIALAIFALISLAGYQVLQGSLRAQEQSLQYNKQMSELSRIFSLMEQDISHALIRQSDIMGKHPGFTVQHDDVVMQFTRRNWPGSLDNARVPLQKIQWRHASGTLVRVRLDDGTSQEFSGVQKIDLRFFFNGQWQTHWEHPYSLPQAIDVMLHTQTHGAVRRIFLPGTVP